MLGRRIWKEPPGQDRSWMQRRNGMARNTTAFVMLAWWQEQVRNRVPKFRLHDSTRARPWHTDLGSQPPIELAQAQCVVALAHAASPILQLLEHSFARPASLRHKDLQQGGRMLDP